MAVKRAAALLRTTTMVTKGMTVMKTMQKMTTLMANNTASDKDKRAIQVSNLSSIEETKQIKKGLK
jgi:hypothetical protein